MGVSRRENTLLGGTVDAFSTASATTVAGVGILDLGGFGQRIASLAGNGTVTNSGVSPVTLMTGDASRMIFSGTIQDGTGTFVIQFIGSMLDAQSDDR